MIRLNCPDFGLRDPRRLWQRYVMALGLVLATVLVGHTMYGNALRDLNPLLASVNDVNQQQILGNKILLVLRNEERRPDGEVLNSLRSSVDLFEAAHDRAVAVAQRVPAVRAHYFDASGPMLDARARDFVTAVRDVLRQLEEGVPPDLANSALWSFQDNGFQGYLTTSVRLFEEAALERTARAYWARDVLTMTALLILVLEAVFIFWPIQKAVTSAMDRLSRSNRNLREKSRVLSSYAGRLAYAAFNDPLTGLYNRKKLHDELETLLGRGDLDERRVCVLHIDLDGFKEVNDRFGHAVGDAVLKRVAEIMRSRVRSSDLIGRIGGDEFVIALEHRVADGEAWVEAICEELIAKISEPLRVLDVEVKIGASIGYTYATPEMANADVLISNADIALYSAKRAGRGRAQFFTGSMRAGIEQRQRTIREIEGALLTGAFKPYFQPQVSIRTGAVVGLELLARWQHPERGLLTPGDFLPIAEETGVIDAIDTRLTVDGLDFLASLHGAGWDGLTMSINASARTMRFSDYPARLKEAVVGHGLDPAHLVVEIRESELLADGEGQFAANIRALSEAGFRVYVDDFGAGYASLAHLSALNIHGLKIDRTLIANVAAERTEQVVAAVIGMAEAMKFAVVAEGVETPAQFSALQRLGGQAAQGFGIATPMPMEEVRGWLDSYGARERADHA
ncbi:putative bifunctional diguanylate cyclase/phosphodiesterase [Ovoidimarina sediminis]|uniref:putative bifunctional diguanylate cyclase/phosphodiesterase n=1 Tax=Ovoidimarina sediminis TaxID=3079856 RepID=UPI002910E7E8|nr:EAL domain-containing protein [Rhodophyticola sp. MJ-SS7]MDU8942473.1 EAL domain-containing protein [Rhodophyticola sp. MJ-SS7]